MNILDKYLREEKLLKGITALYILYKWLSFIAVLSLVVYLTFSSNKEYMYHILILTIGILVIWGIVRIVQLRKSEKLNDIHSLGLKDKVFREKMFERYRNHLDIVLKKLNDNATKKLVRERDLLLDLIEYYSK